MGTQRGKGSGGTVLGTPPSARLGADRPDVAAATLEELDALARTLETSASQILCDVELSSTGRLHLARVGWVAKRLLALAAVAEPVPSGAPSPHGFDLRDALAQALELARPLIAQRIALDARLDRVGFVRGAALDGVQTALDLVLHARDALGRRGERLAVTLRPLRAASVAGRSGLGHAAPEAVLRIEGDGPSTLDPSAGPSGALRATAERLGGTVRSLALTRGMAIELRLPLVDEAPPTIDLADRTILVVAGNAGATGRLTEALERANAEVSLSLDARDAVRTVGDGEGLWDLAIVAGEPRDVPAETLAASLRRADPGLPVAIAVPYAPANGSPTIGHRDDPAAIAAAAHRLMHGRPCAS